MRGASPGAGRGASRAAKPTLTTTPRHPGTGACEAFEALAAGYDESFTHGVIGSLLRAAVWRRLDACFAPGDRVLELNCGTGEDALHLARRGVRVLATDGSAAMLALAREKVGRAGFDGCVELRRLAIEELSTRGRTAPLGPPFDGALSNFGGLNCVAAADLPGVAAGLAACLRPGGVAVLCLMGPLVPWEWFWFLVRGQPAGALRRLRPGGARWRGAIIRYPGIGSVRRVMAPAFRLRRAAALGALLPPTFAERWAVRHPRLLRLLARCERRLEAWPPLPRLADHYLLELVRR
jgi:SAM-dependent methyltransferase